VTGELSVTTDLAERIVRLPLWLGLENDLESVIGKMKNYLSKVFD